MKTVKVYMVQKPLDFEEVKTLCKKYAHEAEEVLIEETINLPPTWYEALCQRPLDSYIFLSGKGGYDDTKSKLELWSKEFFIDITQNLKCKE